MASSIDFSRGEIVRDADQRVTLSNVSWLQYEAMLGWRGESSLPRYAYLDGVLEIMSPSYDHETITSYVGSIIEAYALTVGIDVIATGSWTLRRAVDARGAEGDKSYIIGNQKKEMPDLIIETVWTSGGIDKLEIYNRFGAREVWFIANGNIRVHELIAGAYHERERSIAFPELDLRLVMELVGEPTTTSAQRKIIAWASRSKA